MSQNNDDTQLLHVPLNQQPQRRQTRRKLFLIAAAIITMLICGALLFCGLGVYLVNQTTSSRATATAQAHVLRAYATATVRARSAATATAIAPAFNATATAQRAKVIATDSALAPTIAVQRATDSARIARANATNAAVRGATARANAPCIASRDLESLESRLTLRSIGYNSVSSFMPNNTCVLVVSFWTDQTSQLERDSELCDVLEVISLKRSELDYQRVIVENTFEKGGRVISRYSFSSEVAKDLWYGTCREMLEQIGAAAP